MALDLLTIKDRTILTAPFHFLFLHFDPIKTYVVFFTIFFASYSLFTVIEILTILFKFHTLFVCISQYVNLKLYLVMIIHNLHNKFLKVGKFNINELKTRGN